MKFFKKETIVLVTLMGLFDFAYSQDTSNTIGKVSIASPTSASLGKYGDIPVSYHTGIPNISIPVYTIGSGTLKLAVSLSYHASGIKVQEPAGWVGAGWSLNAGGVITRTVRGAADDKGYMTTLVSKGHYTDMGYSSYYFGESDDRHFAYGIYDGEPDLYFFNFGEYSGKFYFNDDRTPILIPEQDFKILPILEGSQGFVGFIVVSSDGTKYYFGSVGNYSSAISPIEVTNPMTFQGGQTSTAAVSSWYLNKIVSYDNTDSITFTYAQENYSYYSQMWSPILDSKFDQPAADGTLNGFNIVKNVVQGVRLVQIWSKDGIMSFTPSASPRQDLSYSYGLFSGNTMIDYDNTNSFSLGSISIKNTDGFCKKDSFYYGYFFNDIGLDSKYYNAAFVSCNLHTDKYRLRLDSIGESTCDNSLNIPPYKFTYFSEPVPRRLSFAIDHWGYSNGQVSNSGLIPTYTVTVHDVPQTTTLANRDAVWPAMRAGSLQKISYPTGGYTSFDFEPKSSFNYNKSTLDPVYLTGFVLHIYGQSQISQTNPFTLNADGACTIHVDNGCVNWDPVLRIYDNSGQEIYSSGYITSTFDVNLNLPAGNYTATLAFPSNATGLNGGATGEIRQYQYVLHSSTQLVGGLRIKAITNKENLTQEPVVTSFDYGGNLSSSGGTLYSVPTYVQIVRNDIRKLITPYSCSPNGCLSCDVTGAHEYYISGGGNLQPMETMQGENVGYNEVDVSQTGNGTIKYLYYHSNIYQGYPQDVCVRSIIQSVICDPYIQNYPSVPVPFEFMRNELQSEIHFNEAGERIKQVDYYPTYVYDSITTPGLIEINIPGLYSHSAYDLNSAYKVQDKTITTIHDPVLNKDLTTTSIVYYGSPYHHQPTRRVMSTSSGDSIVTSIKYATDFRIPGCDAIPDSISYYYSLFHSDSVNMYSNIATCTPQNDDITNCRLLVYQLFRNDLAAHRRAFIEYRRRSYANDQSNLQSVCYASSMTLADHVLKPVLRLQSNYNNPVIEIARWRNTNLLEASFTEYDTSAYPIGFAYPGRTSRIDLTYPSPGFSNAFISGNSIVMDSRYQDENVFTFINGNPRQITGRDGIIVSYLWDFQDTKPVAKITNAHFNQIAYTSFEADNKGNWVFSGAPVPTGGAVTGAKSYSLGSGSISKSGMIPSQDYILSYWSKGNISVSGGTQTDMLTGKTINGWTFHEVIIKNASGINISGSTYIDELRLYPADAKMTTYTYRPLLGLTSQSDENNKISYYEYDGLGRLKWIKDEDGYIIKKIDYDYSTHPVQN